MQKICLDAINTVDLDFRQVPPLPKLRRFDPCFERQDLVKSVVVAGLSKLNDRGALCVPSLGSRGGTSMLLNLAPRLRPGSSRCFCPRCICRFFCYLTGFCSCRLNGLSLFRQLGGRSRSVSEKSTPNSPSRKHVPEIGAQEHAGIGAVQDSQNPKLLLEKQREWQGSGQLL